MIDAHAHLDHLKDLDGAMARARDAGVEGIVAVSVSPDSCLKNLDIRDKFKLPKVYVAFGMHPSDAEEQRLPECIDLIRKHRAALTAVGEIGLDFWYKWVRKDQEKKDEQRRIFRALCEQAHELDLPAVIHTRGTWRECFETAKDVGIKRAEFHWYSGPIDVLKDILDSGYYVSTSPSVAYSPQSREAILYAPIEQTMIETDSPVYYRTAAYLDDKESQEGFEAEPKDVFRTLEAYCQLKKIDQDKASAILNKNAAEFFQLN